MRNGMAVALALALAATPVAAQERPLGQPADTARPGMMGQPGMMGMMQGMHVQGGMGMMGGSMMDMAGGTMMILRLEESLELTEDQVKRLKTIQETAHTEMRQHMMQGMQAMHAAQGLLDAEAPDLNAYQARLREAANHMVLAHTAMASNDVEARRVLTREQRQRLEMARAMMKELRGSMMQGGMMHDGAGHDADRDGSQNHRR